MTKTILIVDDCLMTATPLEVALGSMQDVETVLLTRAADALKLLARADCHVIAIVTDLHLPQMSGFELIADIRRGGSYAGVPIIVVSGDTNPVTQSRALETGANAFFPKPYSPADVRQELERLIHAS